MKKTVIITFFSIIIFFISCRNTPEDKLDFVNSRQDVTDSLYMLRYLKKFISTDADVINCYIGYHKEFIINSVNIGNFVELVNGAKPIEDSVKKVYSGNIKRLISLMAYLNKNHISGYYIDYSYHIFVFSYRYYEYGDRTSDSRLILFKDEFVGKVRNEFVVKDESEKLILSIYNMPNPKTGRYPKASL
jgi:hypothetical protein